MPGLFLRATAPTRLDFGGGWTDVPPFPQERGGFVCNVAIDRLATVTLEPTSAGVSRSADAAATIGSLPPMVEVALRHAGIAPGHAPAVTLTSDFPIGAGLGGSSAAGVALAAALALWKASTTVTAASDNPSVPTPLTESDRTAFAEQSRAVEIDGLGIAGGRQDHYAAAFGGALGLTFGERVDVKPIALTETTRRALEARCLVFYTGESRISGDTITAVLDAYRNRVPAIVAALDRLAALGREMATALASGDLDALGALVGEHWVHQQSLHPKITTARIDALMDRARAAGAIGGKALGASGGGCVLLIAPADGAARIIEAVGTLGEQLRYRVADRGVAVHPAPRLPRV